MRYLDFNPWRGNALTAGERDAVSSKALHTLTRDQYGFLATFAKRRAMCRGDNARRCMLILAYAMGLRASELCAVKLGHLETKWVDYDIGTAWTLRMRGKGHKPRVVPMPSMVMHALVR